VADPDDELQRTFRELPMHLKREIATVIRDQADELAGELREAAPQGETGRTKESVRVRRGRNTLEVVVSAGGPLTTKPVRNGAVGADYNYALAGEFGTRHQAADPWFYPACRAREAEINAAIEDAVDEILRNP
jgi:Bacteriophage HK97-gp10, putative tail-component